VVSAVAADEAYALAVLVRENPPAVDLLLIDPAVAVERLAHECGGGRRVEREHDKLFYAMGAVPPTRAYRPGRGQSGRELRGDGQGSGEAKLTTENLPSPPGAHSL